MAKQVGLVTLSGTIDGINFYFRKGKAVARKAGGGFNGAAIKTKASMVRVRENNTEFGACSRLKKVFSDCLLFHFANRKEVTLHARLMQLFIAIKDCDVVSERGKRTPSRGLQTLAGQQLLTSFGFTAMLLPDLAMDYSSSTLELHVGSFSLKDFNFPAGATHLELFMGIMDLDLLAHTARLDLSDKIVLAKETTVSDFILAPTTMVVGNGMPLPVLFYSYAQEVNGVFYGLRDASSFGLRILG